MVPDVAEYPDAGIRIEYVERPRGYQVNGQPVPSVTTVLGLLNKPALPFWSAKVTAEGAWKLVRRKGYTIPGDVTTFRNDLKRYGYDHQSVTKNAAGRGVDVHAVLEDWIERQKIPNAADYPQDRRGYIRALSKFLMEYTPEFQESELIVGSAVHGFAGRRDTVAVVKVAGKGRCLLDLKTSKHVYPNSHFPQLAAYELAGVECGAAATDAQGIVRLGADGEFELAWSDAEPEDFLTVLRAYTSQQKWARRR